MAVGNQAPEERKKAAQGASHGDGVIERKAPERGVRERLAGQRYSACYIDGMPGGYLPILIFLAVAIAFPVVAIGFAKLLRPAAPSVAKLEAYECGIRAASDSRGRYTVRFYIVAILFVIFDVETIFLYPWAVRYVSLGWFGVAEVAVFLAILVVGYLWAYKKGALDWV